MEVANADRVSVWYFSFGANMNCNTLRSRGVQPLRSLTGSLPGYQMTFTYNGYDKVEPRFATIDRITIDGSTEEQGVSPNVVQGVAHCISIDELKILDVFEGEGTAYERFETDFLPAESHNSFTCYAYRVLPKLRAECPGMPSFRYLYLLVEGARAAGLSSNYLEKLSETPCLEFEGVAIPDVLRKANATGNCAAFTLNDVKNHDFNNNQHLHNSVDEVTNTSQLPHEYWVTVGGWVFDVSSVVGHRAMLRKMSGIDGTFYCLDLWATAFGFGNEVNMKDMVDMAALSPAQVQYIHAWLHHFVSNYPLIGQCTNTTAL